MMNKGHFSMKFMKLISLQEAFLSTNNIAKDGIFIKYEPRCEKSGPQGFRPGPTQTRLYSHRKWLEA